MYHLNKIVTVADIELPKCMYIMDPVHKLTTTDPLLCINDHISSQKYIKEQAFVDAIEERQEKVLQSLRELKHKLDELHSRKPLTSHSRPSHLNSAACVEYLDKANKVKSGSFLDLVVSANPEKPPYSLVLLRKLLLDVGHPVYSSSHTHSSLHQRVKSSINDLFCDVPRSERAAHDLAVTIHWKDVLLPQLMVNPLMQVKICGEVNIVRYFSRLFPLASPFNYEAVGTFTEIAETDMLLDLLDSQIFQGNNKERQAVLKQLDSRLQKSQYLIGSNFGIADILAWSAFKQIELQASLPANIKKWLNKLESFVGSGKT